MFFLAPLWAPDCDDLSHLMGPIATSRTGSVDRNALPAGALPRNHRVRSICLVRPDKLQKRHRFIVELGIEPADPGEAALRQRQLPFAILDESGTMIGRIFLRHVRHEEGSAVLGIDLHPGYLGLGYGTEALGAFLHHYFETLGFQRMLLSVAAHNVRARRCYEALGFTTVGSHWDAHVGPDVTSRPSYAYVRHLFRRGPLGLESLFYDMRLEGAAWQKTVGL